MAPGQELQHVSTAGARRWRLRQRVASRLWDRAPPRRLSCARHGAPGGPRAMRPCRGRAPVARRALGDRGHHRLSRSALRDLEPARAARPRSVLRGPLGGRAHVPRVGQRDRARRGLRRARVPERARATRRSSRDLPDLRAEPARGEGRAERAGGARLRAASGRSDGASSVRGVGLGAAALLARLELAIFYPATLLLEGAQGTLLLAMLWLLRPRARTRHGLALGAGGRLHRAGGAGATERAALRGACA